MARDASEGGLLAVLGILGLLCYLRIRSRWSGGAGAARIAALLWTPVAAGIALAGALALARALRRGSPASRLRGIEVIASGGSPHAALPSAAVAVAVSIAVGLLLARAPVAGATAVVLSLALGFDELYVGTHFASDVAAGIGVGVVVTGGGFALAQPSLVRLVEWLGDGPLRALVGVHLGRPLATSGPATTAPVIRASGSVRLLARDELPGASGAPGLHETT